MLLSLTGMTVTQKPTAKQKEKQIRHAAERGVQKYQPIEKAI